MKTSALTVVALCLCASACSSSDDSPDRDQYANDDKFTPGAADGLDLLSVAQVGEDRIENGASFGNGADFCVYLHDSKTDRSVVFQSRDNTATEAPDGTTDCTTEEN